MPSAHSSHNSRSQDKTVKAKKQSYLLKRTGRCVCVCGGGCTLKVSAIFDGNKRPEKYSWLPFMSFDFYFQGPNKTQLLICVFDLNFLSSNLPLPYAYKQPKPAAPPSLLSLSLSLSF